MGRPSRAPFLSREPRAALRARSGADTSFGLWPTEDRLSRTRKCQDEEFRAPFGCEGSHSPESPRLSGALGEPVGIRRKFLVGSVQFLRQFLGRCCDGAACRGG